MRIFHLTFATLALMLCSSATACMSSGPDGFSTGLVWNNKPSEVPKDAVVLRVTKIQHIPESWAFSAEVVKGPSRMVGKRYRFLPMNLNSCVGFGSNEGFVVVWKEPVSIENDAGSFIVLEVIDYAPTTMNEVLRVLFGGSQWRYPGEPSERFVWPE